MTEIRLTTLRDLFEIESECCFKMNCTHAHQDDEVAIVAIIITAFDSDHQLVKYSEVYKFSAHRCTIRMLNFS